MRYLVDANVLGEPTKPSPDARAIEWLASHEQDLIADAIIFGELYLGILDLAPGRKRERLETWSAALTGTIDCCPRL